MTNSSQSLVGALMISAAGFLSFYFILQTYGHVEQLRVAVSERKALLESRTKIINDILDLKKDYEANKNKVETISIPIPDKKRIPELISTLEYMANSTGLSLVNLNIIDNKESGSEQINTIQVESKLNGSYGSFKNFLSLIEANRRLIDVTSSKLHLDKLSGNILLDFSGKAYVLKIEPKTNAKKLNNINAE